jgi:hypothetical protein
MNRRAWLAAVAAAPLVALVTPLLPPRRFSLGYQPRRLPYHWVSYEDDYCESLRTGNGEWVPEWDPDTLRAWEER